MKPQNLKTKIFLDGGDVDETKEILHVLGFLDGQTTNPTLISKNPEAQKMIGEGKKFTKKEIYEFYKKVVKQISSYIPQGSVSIEVYSDKRSKAFTMIGEGKEMFYWISNAHIKFPTTHEGLLAAEMAIKLDMRVNMTLCFTQEQAAAVYAATAGAKKGQVFVSPFIGRLDDRGENGMDLVKNIIEMYKKGDGHVEVLSSSVRSMNHFLYAISLGSDINTTPMKILKEWGEGGMKIPENYSYDSKNLKSIPYQEIDLNKSWKEYNIQHELTDIGIEKFSADWNSLIQ